MYDGALLVSDGNGSMDHAVAVIPAVDNTSLDWRRVNRLALARRGLQQLD